ncbi:MAG: MotA/TolQ/ExbB proton channel family protein [Planctomycetaceae bacterium]|nr:MotA/TolQ/ExbB proton channel family protein [Planctomycetaceae bacterium]
MKTRLFVFALGAVTLLGGSAPLSAQCQSIPLFRGLVTPAWFQQPEPTIDLEPAPTGEATPKVAPKKAAQGAEVGQGGLTLGWKQMKELFLGYSSVPMWTLVACSVLTLMLVIERLTALQARRVMPRAFVTRFLQRLREGPLDAAKVNELSEVCRENGSPISRFFAIVVENAGRPSFEIRVTVSDFADSELFHLRKNIRAISGLAMLAPLLGLFGTVLGMISAFHALSQQSGSGKTELLASGISLALIATASGLAVAIVASAAYYYLLGRMDRLIQEMDVLTNQAVALVSSDSRAREGDKKVRRGPAPPSAEQKSA